MPNSICLRCQAPLPDPAQPCPVCRPSSHRTYKGPFTITARQLLLGTLLALAALVAAMPQPRGAAVKASFAETKYPPYRIYKGARLYDRLTGRFAGEVARFRNELDSDTGKDLQLVQLQLPNGRAEWKSRETINRFFTTSNPRSEASLPGVRQNQN